MYDKNLELANIGPHSNTATLGQNYTPNHPTTNQVHTEFNYFGWSNANVMLNACAQNTMICAGVVGLIIVGGIIFITAFTTCSKTYIFNETGDMIVFSHVSPWNTRVNSPFLSPYSRNNLTFGVGQYHAQLDTVSNGEFRFSSSGECHLSGGPSNRELKKSFLSPFFFTCRCDYQKRSGSNSNSTSASQNYLRGSNIDDLESDVETLTSVYDFLNTNEKNISMEDLNTEDRDRIKYYLNKINEEETTENSAPYSFNV